MFFDRKKFFDGFRDKIDSTIEAEQVDGLEFLLGKMEADPFWKDIRHIAYALATAGHETAWSFQPVEEGYYLGAPARVKRFQKTLRYYPFYGRGYVQLTWKKNYEKAGKILGMNLVDAPQLALDREGAYKTMTYGMHQGWFTGKKLSDYISDTGKDYKNARKIINGLDKAGLIAGYANQFEDILRDSKTTSAAAPAEIPPVQNNLKVDGDLIPTPIEQPPGSSVEGERPTESKVTQEKGDTIVEISEKNEQDVNTPASVSPPEPYMGVGFWGVIKRDLGVATGGNLSFSALSEYATQASGWPPWIVGILSKLAIGLLIATFGYLVFRVIHYGVDTWKKNSKVKLEADAATSTVRKDITWQ